MSGVPQLSIMKLALSNILINYLDSEIECTHSTFADETKLKAVVVTIEGRNALQRDMRGVKSRPTIRSRVRCCTWVRAILVCILGEELLESSPMEKDILAEDKEILAGQKLDMNQQRALISKKSIRFLGFIKRWVARRAREVIIPLYSSFVRLYLEYCNQDWRLQYKKVVELLEKTQSKVSKAR